MTFHDFEPASYPTPDTYNRWIPVERDTPHHGDIVFGYCPEVGNPEEGYGVVCAVRWVTKPLVSSIGHWQDAWGNEVRVTHWTPLLWPAPPDAAMKDEGMGFIPSIVESG